MGFPMLEATHQPLQEEDVRAAAGAVDAAEALPETA